MMVGNTTKLIIKLEELTKKDKIILEKGFFCYKTSFQNINIKLVLFVGNIFVKKLILKKDLIETVLFSNYIKRNDFYGEFLLELI